jgi:hypothetical protein
MNVGVHESLIVQRVALCLVTGHLLPPRLVKGQKVSGNNGPNKSVMANCARRIGNRDYGDFLPIRPPGARNIEAGRAGCR